MMYEKQLSVLFLILLTTLLLGCTSPAITATATVVSSPTAVATNKPSPTATQTPPSPLVIEDDFTTLSHHDSSEPTASPTAVPPITTHAAQTRTGIEEVDKVLDAFLEGSINDKLDTLTFVTTGCTHESGLGGPPKCDESAEEGMLVDVFPILGAEGHFLGREQISAEYFADWENIGLYAVYRVSEDVFFLENYPAGEFAIILIDTEHVYDIVLQLNHNGVVRIDYNMGKMPEITLEREAAEIILPPQIESTKLQSYALPSMNHNIIFLVDEKLQLWQHSTNKIETLATPNILKYSLSEDGKQLVVAKQIGFDPDSYELVFLDLRNNHSQVIVENNHCLHDFAISPDGTRLLYIADDWNPDEQQCQAKIEREGETLWTFSPPFSNGLGGIIYIADIDDDMETAVVGHCNSTISGDVYISQFAACTTAYWTIDSQHIIWFDAEGIWSTDLTSNQPTMLLPLFQDDEDHIYTSMTWSPSGKLLMVKGNSLHGNKSRRLTINWQTGQVVEAPYPDYSYYGMGVYPLVVWSNDDTLFVTKERSVAEIWEFSQDGNVLLLKNTTNLASPDSKFMAYSPYQLSDGTLTYALLSPYIENEQEHGLYKITSLSHDPEKIIELPRIHGSVEVLWNPDENGAIITYWIHADDGGWEKQFYYASTSSDILYNITQTLGEAAEDIQWLP